MTKSLSRALCRCLFFLIAGSATEILAQTSPTPAAENSSSSTAIKSSDLTATPPSSVTPKSSPAKSIRISFLPPPLEGKISLGVYDAGDQLVRVLQQEADVDDFTIGADALQTRWDGKDNDGADVPPGKYHARGFLIAPTKIEESSAEPLAGGSWSTKIKLVANPLENNERPMIQLAVGFDDENVYLQTVDGLPLVTLAQTGDIKAAMVAPGRDGKSIDVQLTNEAGSRLLRLSGVDKMMSFDAGDFEIK